MKKYSEKIIRGIPNKQFVDDDGIILGGLFHFEDKVRDDGVHEVSINWYDNEDSLCCVMDKTKSDETKQFKVGAAILLRKWVDDLIIRPNTKKLLSYERRSIPRNKYHGNILLKHKNNETFKQVKNLVAACLANCVDYTISREEYENKKYPVVQ